MLASKVLIKTQKTTGDRDLVSRVMHDSRVSYHVIRPHRMPLPAAACIADVNVDMTGSSIGFNDDGGTSVSYTHLTLPTIYSV